MVWRKMQGLFLDTRMIRVPEEYDIERTRIRIEEERMRQEDEEDEEARKERRRRIQERLLKNNSIWCRVAHPETDSEEKETDSEEEETDSEEGETDYEEEESSGVTMTKALERRTVVEEEEERAMEELVRRRLEETRRTVLHKIREKMTKNKETRKKVGLEGNVSDDDQTNEADENEAWKRREIARFKRDRDELKEKEEMKRVRSMTQEERKDCRERGTLNH